jgi:hypothetical protein
VPSVYVLEFSCDGLVIDVLHKSYRYKRGHSPLRYTVQDRFYAGGQVKLRNDEEGGGLLCLQAMMRLYPPRRRPFSVS